jgi:hypothetical protein
MITLTATTFDSHVEGIKTYGFRIYDENNKVYDNNSKSPIVDDIDLLEYALTVDDYEIKAMLSHIKENEKGMTINSQYYDWEEIKEYF